MNQSRATTSRDLRIEYRSLKRIKPLTRNAKLHDLDEIIKSISLYGFVDPIGVNETTNVDVDGNGRLEALQEMERLKLAVPRGIKVDAKGKWLAPVVRGISVPKERQDAFALEMNRANERGGFDENVLAELLVELSQVDSGMGLEGSGYTQHDLEELLLKLKHEQEKDKGPEGFRSLNDVQTESKCPRCGYTFSGSRVVKKDS